MSKILRQFCLLIGLRSISIALALAFVLIVTDALSPEAFGQYSLLVSMMQIVSAALVSWPNQAFLRYAREEYSATGAMATTLRARLAIHGVLLLVAVSLAWAFGPLVGGWIDLEGAPAIVFVIVGVVVISTGEMGNVAAQVGERFSGYGVAPILLKGAQLAAILLVLAGVGATWEFLAVGTLVGYGLGAVYVWFRAPRARAAAAGSVRAAAGRMLRYSWSLPVAVLSVHVMAWMDIWFLRAMADFESVGVYAWAYNISLLATTLLVPLSVVMAPRMIDLRVDEDKDRILGALRGSSALVALAASLVPVGLGVVIVFFSLLDLGDFAPALAPILILSAGTVFQLCLALSEPVVFSHEDLIHKNAMIMVGMAIMNAVGNWLLIPVLGINGPAVSTAFAFALSVAVQWSMLQRRIGRARGAGPVRLVVFAGLPVALALYLAVGLWVMDGAAVALVCGALTLGMLAFARQGGLFAGLGALAAGFGRAPVAVLRTCRWLDGGEV